MTDEELIDFVKNGKIDFFNPLVVKYTPYIRRTILKIVRNESDVDDIMSKVFMKVYDNLSSYSSSHAFSTWINNIARNTAIDFIRQKKRTIVISDDISSEENSSIQIADNELSIEDKIINSENTDSLQNMIECLKPEEQFLLYLKYHEGKTYEELSKELNISINSIKANLFRSRTKLRKLIKLNKNL